MSHDLSHLLSSYLSHDVASTFDCDLKRRFETLNLFDSKRLKHPYFNVAFPPNNVALERRFPVIIYVTKVTSFYGIKHVFIATSVGLKNIFVLSQRRLDKKSLFGGSVTR